MEIYKKRKSGATSPSEPSAKSYGQIRSIARGPVVSTPSGRRRQSVYLPSLGENAYMDIDTDRIMSEAEVVAAIARHNNAVLTGYVKASKESSKRSPVLSTKSKSQLRAELVRDRGLKDEWEQSNVVEKPKNDFSRYAAGGKFDTGELINHPKFGKGFVRRVVDSNRIEILFEDGVRTLPQNLAPREKRTFHWDTK